jgi:hypothetical protein
MSALEGLQGYAPRSDSSDSPVAGIKPPAPTSEFHQLIREALDVTQRLLKVSNGGRLSAESALSEAMTLAGTTKEAFTKLRAALEGQKPGLDHARAGLNALVRFVREGNWKTIPKDGGQLLARLRNKVRPEAAAELARFDANTLSLFAIAIWIGTERFPGLFGSVQGSDQLNTDVAALRNRANELQTKLSTSFRPEDIDYGTYDKGVVTPATFKLSGGVVPIAPEDSAGKRLVEYLMSHREKRP